MKRTWTLFLLSASLFVVLASMTTLAQETTDLQVKITTTEDLRVQLTAQNKTGKTLYLTVLMQDQTGFNRLAETEIYSEEIAGEVAGFTRVLNLSQLESGKYRIRLKAGKQHVDRLLDIRTKPVYEDSRTILLQ